MTPSMFLSRSDLIPSSSSLWISVSSSFLFCSTVIVSSCPGIADASGDQHGYCVCLSSQRIDGANLFARLPCMAVTAGEALRPPPLPPTAVGRRKETPAENAAQYAPQVQGQHTLGSRP